MKTLMCKCGTHWQEYAPLALRIVVGLSFALHGLQKLQGGMDGVTAFFVSLGIPAAAFFAVVVTWVELLGGIALIVGLYTHWAAKLLAIDMGVAIITAHLGKGYFTAGGGPELALILLGATLSLMITGAGKYSLDKKWLGC